MPSSDTIDLLKALESSNGNLELLAEKLKEETGTNEDSKQRKTIVVDLDKARDLFLRKPEILNWKDKDGGTLLHVLCGETGRWEDDESAPSAKRRELFSLIDQLTPGAL